jgi:alpha-glucosidase
LLTLQALKVDDKNQADIPTPLGNINVHIRPGSIFLIHSTPAYGLTDTRTSEYGIIISLNDVWAAKGTAILDDGLSTEGE